MKCANLAASALLVFFLAACEDEAKYPVTGEECGPDDPVRTLDASDCASAAPLATGF